MSIVSWTILQKISEKSFRRTAKLDKFYGIYLVLTKRNELRNAICGRRYKNQPQKFENLAMIR